MKTDTSKVGQEIRKIRAQLGMTQKQFANRVNLTSSYLSLLERGKRKLSLERLNELAEALGVPPYLLVILATDASDTYDKDAKALLKQIQLLARQVLGLFVTA